MRRTLLVCVLASSVGVWIAWKLVVAQGQGAPAPPRAAAPQAANSGRQIAAPAEGRLVPVPVAPDELTPDERVNIDVYERVNRSVAHINTRASRSESFLFFEVPSESSGSGSGSVLDQRGHILTNYHVVEGADEIAVTLFDGNPYDARLVGADPTSDVAVLHISAPANVLFPITPGDSTTLRVGQRALAIGNPFGLERTLSTGVVSSLNRVIPGRNGRLMKSMIQIDAAINPGNSGGPLLDSHGRLIGMNTAIATKTGQSSGVGFAIPVSTILQIAPQLIATGRVSRPEIGILRVFQTENGYLVDRLLSGGPAEQAGLRGPKLVRKRQGPLVYERIDRSAADLIVAIDGRRVTTADEFLSYVESKRPGEQVMLSVIREGQPQQIPVRLGEAEGGG